MYVDSKKSDELKRVHSLKKFKWMFLEIYVIQNSIYSKCSD